MKCAKLPVSMKFEERYKKRTFTILVPTWITLFKNGLGGGLPF